MTSFDFTSLENPGKLPSGDPRGILAHVSLPDQLQRLWDSRLDADFNYRIVERPITEFERAFLIHLGYLDAEDDRPVRAHHRFVHGLREQTFKFIDGTMIGDSDDQR